MLEHTGRRTGLPRYVCLEVVHRTAPDVYFLASGFGTTAQWYRNMVAHPECRVSVGRRYRVPSTSQLLDPEDARSMLDRYQRAHPRAWRRLGAIETATGRPVDDLPMVALTLH